MNSLTALINLIATAISFRVTRTLSQRLAQTHAEPRGPSWLQRLGARMGLSPGLQLQRPSAGNQQRLEQSQAAVRAAMRARNEAREMRDQAEGVYQKELASPTGKNLQAIRAVADRYEQALQDAAKSLQQLTDEHDKLRLEVSRQTKWQTQRTQGNRWGVKRLAAKSRQQWRIIQKRFARVRKARTGVRTATAVHEANLNRQRAAQDAQLEAWGRLDRAKRSGTADEAQKAFDDANRHGRAAQRAGAASQRSSGALEAAKAAVGSQLGGAIRGVAGSMKSLAGPIGLAVGVLVVAVTSVRKFIDRQLQQSEAMIQGQFRERAQVNGRFAASLARHDVQDVRLNLRTAGQTAASASGVVRSTMALREARQARDAKWEEIANRWQAFQTDTATRMQKFQDSIDVLTPTALSLVKMLEVLPWVKKIEANTNKAQEQNPGVAAIGKAWERNTDQFFNKAFPPLPPMK